MQVKNKIIDKNIFWYIFAQQNTNNYHNYEKTIISA